MRAVGIGGEIDDDHFLPGRVQLIIVRPDEDGSGAFWPWDVSRAWIDDLGDARQTLADDQPVDASR